MDWGVGDYELTADELMPYAEVVVAAAAIQPGERVLDLGCGTGNAAAVAVAAGAEVVGIDPAERLIDVARERVPDAEFLVGSAEDLPFADESFDCVVSIFAVIFAPDADRAVAEVVRVMKPDGRAFITSWVPAGPIDAGIGTLGRAVAELSPDPPRRSSQMWGKADEVRALAERHGAHADIRVEPSSFVVPSADVWIDRFLRRHPMGIPMAAALEKAGRLDDTRALAIERMRDNGEQVDGGLKLSTQALVTQLSRAA
jgi:SAM-dependent methyltransferase